MHLNGNAVAVILHVDNNLSVGHTTYNYINVLDWLTLGQRTNKRIPSIHDDLVENLVEPWIESYLTVNHLRRGRIKDPANLLMCLRATYVSVRKLKNVLAVSVLLILVSHGLYAITRVPLMGQFL